MEEDLRALIEQVEPGLSNSIQGLDQVRLESKYLPALDPNPQLVRIFYRHISHVSNPPKASLVVAHGFGESSLKYLEAAVFFALAGYDVHLVDQRNAGLSGGCRAGHDAYEIVKDLNKLIQQVKPELPCYLWGHSMGGLIGTYLLMNNPMFRVSGAIITSPAYRLVQEFPKTMEVIISFLAPKAQELMLNIPIPLSALSRNDSFLRGIFNDRTNVPLAGFPYCASVKEMKTFVTSNYAKLKCPVLFMHGDKDVITSHRATEELYQKCGSADKTLKIYPGGYHELHHDLEKERWFREVLDWLEARVASARPVGSVGRLRSVADQTGVTRSYWKIWLIVLAVAYLIGAVLFKTKTSAKLVRWIAFTLVPKTFWPVFLPFSRFLGKN